MFFKPMPACFLLGKYKERYMSELQVEGIALPGGSGRARQGGADPLHPRRPFVMLLPAMTNLGYTYTPVTYKAESTPLPRYLTAMQWYGASLGCDLSCP